MPLTLKTGVGPTLRPAFPPEGRKVAHAEVEKLCLKRPDSLCFQAQ